MSSATSPESFKLWLLGALVFLLLMAGGFVEHQLERQTLLREPLVLTCVQHHASQKVTVVDP